MIRFSILLTVALCFLSAAPRWALCQDAANSPVAHWTSDAEAAMGEALAGKAEFELNETPLADAMKAIGKEYHVSFVIDQAALEADGLDPSMPVSLSVSGISLRSALSLALEPLQLTTIVQDEVLKVTTLLEAETNLSVRVYPVADLLGTTHFDDQVIPDFEPLTELIVTIVDPDTWDEVGGDSSISSSEVSRSLIISQTRDSHDDIQAVLSQLRAAKAKQRVPRLRKPDPGEMITRIHNLDHLDMEPPDVEGIIVRVVEPKGWSNNPDVFIKATMYKLIVRHTRCVQDKIADFLAKLKEPESGMTVGQRGGGF